jgi:hypothetical protein
MGSDWKDCHSLGKMHVMLGWSDWGGLGVVVIKGREVHIFHLERN